MSTPRSSTKREFAEIGGVVPLFDGYGMTRRRLAVERPEVDRAGLLVEEPLAGAVEARQGAHEEVGVAGVRLVRVGGVVLVLDLLFRGGIEAQGLAGLVVGDPPGHAHPPRAGPQQDDAAVPVAWRKVLVREDFVAGALPGGGAVVGHQLAGGRVRPARLRHHLSIHKELDELEIRLQLVDAALVRLPGTGERVRAAEDRPLAGRTHEADRLPRLTGFCRAQCLPVRPRAEKYRVPGRSHRRRLAQRLPRRLLRPGTGIIPVGRYPILRRR